MSDKKDEHWHHQTPWVAHRILDRAYRDGHPVIFLVGAGVSVDSGFPLATAIAHYLVQVDALARLRGFNSVREYVDEMRWPGRHDLRLELLRARAKQEGDAEQSFLEQCSLNEYSRHAERISSQNAMIAELRRTSPTLAHSLEEVFNIDEHRGHWNQQQLAEVYGTALQSVRDKLAHRIPPNVGYRSLLFHLSENNQSTIDACFDHFRRDRSPTTTHQFLVFLAKLLRTQVLFTTNFDTLVEEGFASEGLRPTVYEVQGDGSIPSPKLILSQPMSVLKLHGGTHNIRTGFDLDDPLSREVLASFEDLYVSLEARHRTTPLTVVMGYSGSDRRIMDVITSQVRLWRRGQLERVLWVNRGKYAPALLNSAIRSSPSLFNDSHDTEDSPVETSWETSKDHGKFPAHVVNYWDGRLFLFEMYQSLAGHFPSSRSRYQCISPAVPSTRTPQAAISELEKLASDLCDAKTSKPKPTTIAFIEAQCIESASQALSTLARDIEPKGFNVIWIDLTEVLSTSSFVDQLSERFTKLDKRLQGLRRPLFVQDITNRLRPSGKHVPDEAMEDIETRDTRIAVQWIRHALRRDKYLLAIDSLDEFPNSHEADVRSENKPSGHGAKDDITSRERKRLRKLLIELLTRPSLIGDSRVVLALTTSGDNSKALIEEAIKASATLNVCRVTSKPDGSAVPDTTQQIHTFLENGFSDARSIGKERLQALAVCVASSKKRPRSEAFLIRCVTHLLGQPKEPHKQSLIGYLNSTALTKLLDPQHWIENTIVPLRDARECPSQRCDKPWDNEVREMVRDCADNMRPRLFTRREGGYHWMRYQDRTDVYTWLQSNYRGSLPVLHHVIALIIIDELYERSSDPRALIEYLFHRSASFREAAHMCRAQRNAERIKQWAQLTGQLTRRAIMTLKRERDTLLANARLPTLLSQIADTVTSMVTADSMIKATMSLKALRTHKPSLASITDVRVGMLSDVGEMLDILAACLAMSGHPHQAAECRAARLRVILATARQGSAPIGCSDLFESSNIFDIVNAASLWTTMHELVQDLPLQHSEVSAAGREQALDRISAVSDFCWTMHDPVLWPSTSQSAGKWISLLAAAIQRPAVGAAITSNSKWPRRYTCIDSRRGHIDRTAFSVDAKAKLWLHNLAAYEWMRAGFTLTPENISALELDGRLVHRALEHELFSHDSCLVLRAWTATAVLHASALVPQSSQFEDHDQYTGRLKTLRSGRAKAAKIIKLYSSAFSEGMGELSSSTSAILRASSRLQRYECYRLCVTGRWLSACDLAEEYKYLKDGDVDPNRNQHWSRVRQLYEDAESILDRQGSAADLQALAVTRVLFAECLVRRAEGALFYTEDGAIKHELYKTRHGGREGETEYLTQSVWAIHSDCGLMLRSIESVMEQGRAENRWRMLYQLTTARYHMLRARLEASAGEPPWKSRVALFDAARQLIGALTNTGKYTHRWTILRIWWDAWQAAARRLLDDPGDKKCKYSTEFISDVRGRLGVQWCDEDALTALPPSRRLRRT